MELSCVFPEQTNARKRSHKRDCSNLALRARQSSPTGEGGVEGGVVAGDLLASSLQKLPVLFLLFRA